jgi:hypothetical protein
MPVAQGGRQQDVPQDLQHRQQQLHQHLVLLQQYLVLWQQGLSAVVEAWQGLLTMVHSTRAVGLYQLMPDLIKAIDVGDADAATCFKQVRVSQG